MSYLNLSRLCVVLSGLISAALYADTATFITGSSPGMYRCIDPDPPLCHALSTDTGQCTGCVSWRAVFLQVSESVVLDTEAYSYSAVDSTPRANLLLKDAADQLFEDAYPQTEFGHPVPVSEFYSDLESYGWTEIKGGESTVGTLAIWPTVGGVIVPGDAQDGGGNTDASAPMVLYPSHSNQGQLILAEPESLQSIGIPKFVVPQSALINDQ